jgi:hypothetical protein
MELRGGIRGKGVSRFGTRQIGEELSRGRRSWLRRGHGGAEGLEMHELGGSVSSF